MKERCTIRRARFRAPVFLACLVGGCAAGDALDYAQGPQLTDAVSGHSYVGTMADGTGICVFHSPTGRFLGRNAGLISGSWTVDDDALCYGFEQGGSGQVCQQAVIIEDRIGFFSDDTLTSEGRLSQGSVCS